MKSPAAKTLESQAPVIFTPVNLWGGIGIIGMSKPRLCALVSPTLIVCAVHYSTGKYQIPVGTPVTFLSSNANAEQTTIRGIVEMYADVCFMRLSAPVKSVTPYSIASLAQIRGADAFISAGILDISSNNPKPVITPHTALKNSTAFVASFRFIKGVIEMEAGDSGAPDFVFDKEGTPLLIGPHAGANLAGWTTSLVDPYYAQIQLLF